jgi:hypothetical protein
MPTTPARTPVTAAWPLSSVLPRRDQPGARAQWAASTGSRWLDPCLDAGTGRCLHCIPCQCANNRGNFGYFSMEVMGDDERLMQEHGRFVVAAARELEARRTLVVAEARAERRRGRRLRDVAAAARDRNLDLSWRLWSLMALPEPPSTIPLSWDVPPTAAERLEAACLAAEECAEACAAALQGADGEARRTLASISGVAAFAADCGRADLDSRRALSLCVRVIESNSGPLDSLGRTTGGALAASSSRRCATECSRSLAASYLELEG